jgi:chloramphenicol-sensitive protein RarD
MSASPSTLTASEAHRDSVRGFWAAVSAFTIWGLLPLYLKLLTGIAATQITAHRLVWGCLFTTAVVVGRGEWPQIRAALANRRSRLYLCASSLLITSNWIIYAWAITNGHVIESSLGYFINPLFNILLGVFVLSEKLNRAQWMAVAVAAAGVIFLAWTAGRPPWIALGLAATFGSYGLLRKLVTVEALPGLTTETLLAAPFALIYLFWCHSSGTGAFGNASALQNVMLIVAGPVSAIPLVLFAYGTRRIPYSTVGVLQYIGPTLQFLSGLLLFHEAFDHTRALGFILIWAALAIYGADGIRRSRRAPVAS